MQWYIKALKDYAVFKGRSRRKEYWMFSLVHIIIFSALAYIDIMLALAEVNILSTIYAIAVFIPGLAVTVRRLHDTNRSGWWIFISFIPVIGAIVLIVFLVQDSQPGENQYGPNPKEIAAAAV